jgi:hypothetical protein
MPAAVSHLNLHDVLLDAQSAAAAAASFPAIVSETLKYLAAASGNHQMAAAFANSMASLNPNLKSLDSYRSSMSRPPAPLIPTGSYNFSSHPLTFFAQRVGRCRPPPADCMVLFLLHLISPRI